jgi:hypothetical protein
MVAKLTFTVRLSGKKASYVVIPSVASAELTVRERLVEAACSAIDIVAREQLTVRPPPPAEP